MNSSLINTRECEMWRSIQRSFERQTQVSIDAGKIYQGVKSLDTLGRLNLPLLNIASPIDLQRNCSLSMGESPPLISRSSNRSTNSASNSSVTKSPRLLPLSPTSSNEEKHLRKQRRRKNRKTTTDDSGSVATINSANSNASSRDSHKRSKRNNKEKNENVAPTENNRESWPSTYEDVVSLSQSFEPPHPPKYHYYDRSPIRSVFELNNYKTYPIMEREFLDNRHLSVLM